MLRGDRADQLLDQNGLADTGTAEQADLAALRVGREQVHDLDSRLEDLLARGQVLDLRRVAMDRPALVGVDVALLVDRLAEQVEDPAERRLADGHCDRPAGVADLRAPCQAVGRVHRHGAHPVVAQVLLHLADERLLLAVTLDVDLERVVDVGQVVR